MGCNASKVPGQIEAGNTHRLSALDFTTSTDFFRTGSSLLLWKPQKKTGSNNNDKTHKTSAFEEFKEQQHQQEEEEQKHNDLVGRVVGGSLITSFDDELNSNKHNDNDNAYYPPSSSKNRRHDVVDLDSSSPTNTNGNKEIRERPPESLSQIVIHPPSTVQRSLSWTDIAIIIET